MHPRLVAGLYSSIFSSASARELTDGSLAIESDPGRYLAWIIAFLVILPLSCWCWRRRIGAAFAPGAFFAAFTIPLIIVPGIATESIVVTPQALTLRTGLWFSPTVREISLQGLEEVVEKNRAIRQRAVPRTDTFWHFHYRDGNKKTLQLPDLLIAQRRPLARYLRAQGIPFGNR